MRQLDNAAKEADLARLLADRRDLYEPQTRAEIREAISNARSLLADAEARVDRIEQDHLARLTDGEQTTPEILAEVTGKDESAFTAEGDIPDFDDQPVVQSDE